MKALAFLAKRRQNFSHNSIRVHSKVFFGIPFALYVQAVCAEKCILKSALLSQLKRLSTSASWLKTKMVKASHRGMCIKQQCYLSSPGDCETEIPLRLVSRCVWGPCCAVAHALAAQAWSDMPDRGTGAVGKGLSVKTVSCVHSAVTHTNNIQAPAVYNNLI